MNEQTHQHAADTAPVAIKGLHSLCNDLQIAGCWDKIQLKLQTATVGQMANGLL